MRPLRGLAWGAYAGLLAGVGIAMMIVPVMMIASFFEADPSLPTGFYGTAIYAVLGLAAGALVGTLAGGVLGFLYTAAQLDQHANWIAGPGLALAVVWFGLANDTLVTYNWWSVAATLAAAAVLALTGWTAGRLFARKMSGEVSKKPPSKDQNVSKAITAQF